MPQVSTPPSHRRAARWPLLGPAILGLACLVPAACSPSSEASAAPGEEADSRGARTRELSRVRGTRIERREMVQVLETTAKLESEGEIEIFPRMSGIAVEVLVEEGDRVSKGDVLVRIDERDTALSVSDAKVMLEEAKNSKLQAEVAVEEAAMRIETAALAARQAERDYERDQNLFGNSEVASPLSQQQIETSMLARDNAQHEEKQVRIAWRQANLVAEAASNAVARSEVGLERAELMHSYTQITAPFDGIVAERSCRVGDSCGVGTAAFVLTDTENLRAVFPRPQEELELFTREADENGSSTLSITATAEAYEGRSYEGWVERISPTIERESGQFRVTARLRSPKDGVGRLLPGMLVRMTIVTDRHPDALVLPKRALRREGDRRYVLIMEPTEDASERVLRRVGVDEGYSDDDFVEILVRDGSELNDDAEVVLVGNNDLVDGDLVQLDVEPTRKTPDEEVVDDGERLADGQETDASED